MTIRLETWLRQATCNLSKESADRVRAEIQEHYESTREAAMLEGATSQNADAAAIAALGDPKVANRLYREVLLTSEEARLFREGQWEAKVYCSKFWMKWMALVVPVALLLVAGAMYVGGDEGLAGALLAGAAATGVLVAAPVLPIYTPLRGRIFRVAKWTLMIGFFALALSKDGLESMWLVTSCLWPLAWVEWKRMSIRRKLPVARWPKQLYL